MRPVILALIGWVALPGAAAQSGSGEPPPSTTVVDALVATRQRGWSFALELADIHFKAKLDQFPGTAAWRADLEALRARLGGRSPAAGDLDIDALTTANPKFWQMVYEVFPADPQLAALVGGLELAAGEVYRAEFPVVVGMRSPGRADDVQALLGTLYRPANRLLELNAARIDVGIRLHDAGDYAGAIEVYRALVADWPQSGWAHYELGQSIMVAATRAAGSGSGSTVDPFGASQPAYASSRRHNPLDHHAYQGTDRAVFIRFPLVMKVESMWQGLKRGTVDSASIEQLSVAAQVAELHSLALWSRQLLVAIRGRYAPEDHPFISKSLRALAPGEPTEAAIARLAGPPMPVQTWDGPPRVAVPPPPK